MTSNRPRLVFSIVIFAVVLAACTPSGGGAAPTGQGPRTVQVQMTDELRFEPAAFTMQAGETVRFEVTNSGQIVHEFLIGDEAAQDEFEMQMSEGGAMGHDTDAGVSVEPGESETFEYTFTQAGELLVGCHEPGHYDGGMMATITVEE
ncbi:MAG: plastocyanin/azurin family copper-binding protein [Chloroflexota bacterium]